MNAILIDGGKRLEGAVEIHGAKNSVLPILAACVLCRGKCVLHNCPDISDVDTSISILQHLGCSAEKQDHTLIVDTATVTRWDIPLELMRDMRSSVLFMGAVLSRCGAVDLVTPGGCALGLRPIDYHVAAMEQMGAICIVDGERVHCSAPHLQGCCITFPTPSVGATENAMLAAVGCCGCVVLQNAAMEPEIVDLACFLRAMGADISGDGTDRIEIRGGKALFGTEYTVMPDRIETATYLAATAACGGEVVLAGGQRQSVEAVVAVLEKSGCEILEVPQGLQIRANGRLRSPGVVQTAPHPGFPTDAQAPVMAALLRADGTTGFTETIFENRMRHVPELQRMGADIGLYGDRAVVRGVDALHGAELWATDLRCGAALVIAALSAQGQSRVFGVQYIARGYEDLIGNLKRIGACIDMIQM